MKNMLSCLFLFFKQTDCTNWTQFPRTGQIRTRFQWQTNWHRTKLLSGLWHPLCSLCVSQRTPGSFTQPQITPQMPSYSALSNNPLICLWSSQLAYGLFGKVNFRSVGRPNMRGRGTNSSTGVQSLWAGVPRQRLTAWDYRTHLSQDNRSNRSYGILSPFALSTSPKKKCSCRLKLQ